MGDPTWHKHFQLYVTYPDAFCIDGECTLYQLIDQIPRIKQLGFNAIHVLPPFESPMIDKGFDVSDYYTIKAEYGGNDAFEQFLATAQNHDMHVFVDFVLNHVSDQHEWFQKAIAGDTHYQNYFVTRREQPLFEKVFEKDGIPFARYHDNNQTYDIRIVFPEHAGDIPHWVQHNGVWYYHTFYPQQIDLDWHNPEVFREMSRILTYWAKKGCSFRLDAVTHIGKRWEDSMRPHTPTTHKIIQNLRQTLAQTNPQSTFLVEVNTTNDMLKPYLGTNTQPESDLAYEFELAAYLWVALLLQETEHIWQLLEQIQDIPDHTQWVTFLRNHDDLSLKYADLDTRARLFKAFPEDTASFHYGYATSGRTISFLHNDPKRSIIAHLLLASLPGNPALIYGDEIGKTNDIAYMKEQTQLKLDEGVHAEDDTRDIGRGQITENDLNTPNAQIIQNALREIFTTRVQYPDLATSYPTRIETNQKDVFAAKYSLEAGELHVFINLGEESVEIKTQLTNPILTIHDVELGQGSITLGAYSGVWVINEA